MPTTQEIDFGNLAVERRLATHDQIRECFAIQQQLPQPSHIGAILVKKGYISQHHASMLMDLQRSGQSAQGSSGGFVSPAAQGRGPGSTNGGSGVNASAGAEGDRALAKLILDRGMLDYNRLRQALDEVERYRSAGHAATLAQVLLKYQWLDRTTLTQLMQQLQAGGTNGSGAHAVQGSAAFASPASQSGYPSHPGTHPGGSSHGSQAGFASPGYSPPAAGPMIAPAAQSGYGGAGAQSAFGGPAGQSAYGGPAPIIGGVVSQTMNPESSAGSAFGGTGAQSAFGGGTASGGAPLETCISPEDPIAQKMQTVKKPDGTFEILFGPYDILGEIARGGMGIVYRARQRDLKRIVALKVMKDGENASEKQIRRFRRETEAAAKLQHPNIVAVHEVGCIEGFHFFTMDLIEGDPLDIKIKRGERPAMEESVKIVHEVSRAIHYAHSKKIVHRDLKPANILTDLDGHPKVTDFGLAKNVDHKSMLTRTGAVVGTPYYMPPEQARGDTDIDARCDVYALGVILYELLTGKLPFKGETTMEVYHKILEEEPIPPRQHNPKISKDLDVIILKAMDKERGRRYQSAKELAEDLQRYLDNEPIKARPLGLIGRLHRKAKKNRGAVMMGTAAACVLSLFGGFIINWAVQQNLREWRIKARQEWDQYTAEIDNALINARSSISSASAKTKDGDDRGAQRDLVEAEEILERLPLLINEWTNFNSRASAGLYYMMLDRSMREKLFRGGTPIEDADLEGVLAEVRARVEKSQILTSEPPNVDDPFADIDSTAYVPCTLEDIKDYIAFARSGSTDRGRSGEDSQAYRVESALPVKDLREFRRDILRERGNAHRLQESEAGYRDALAAYQEALTYDSDSKVAKAIRLEIGKVLAASGSLDKSLATFKAILADAPDYTSAFLERGRIYDRLGRYAEAIRDYSQVIDKDFEPIDAYLARGRTYAKIGLYDKALEDFEQVIELKDDSFEGYLERGLAHLALGSYDESKTDLDEAIDLNASLPEGYSARARLFFLQGKLQEAIKDYDVALLRNARSWEASLGLGEVYEWDFNYKEARARYRSVIDATGKGLEPYKARAHAALGRLLALEADRRAMEEAAEGDAARAKSEFDEACRKAMSELDAALTIDPDQVDALATRGRLLLARGRTKDAIEDLQKAIDLMKAAKELASRFSDDEGDDDDDGWGDFGSAGQSAKDRRKQKMASLHGLLAMASIELGDLNAAKRHREESSKASKKSGLALIAEGVLKTRSGAGAEARDPFDRSVKLLKAQKSEAGVFYREAVKRLNLARDSRKPEHFDTARKAFARVLFLNPWHAPAWFERSRLELVREKTLDGAVTDVTRALEVNPWLYEAFEFRGFLYARDLPEQPGERGARRFKRDAAKAAEDFSKAITLADSAIDRVSKKDYKGQAEIWRRLAHAYYGRALAAAPAVGPEAAPVDEAAARPSLADLDKAIAVANRIEDLQKSAYETAADLRARMTYHTLRGRLLVASRGAGADADDLAAVEALQKKAKLKAETYFARGKANQDKRRFNDAIEAFDRSIEFDPEHSTAFYDRGLCYLKIGNFIPGILDFSRALELDPRYADQFYNKVYQVNYVVDLKRVMDELNKIVEERPNVSYVIFLRGFFYVAKSEFKQYDESDLDKGVKDFDRCLELNPTHVTAKTYRGLLYYKKKMYERAHQDYDAALELDGKSGISHYLKGLCYATESGEAKTPKDKKALQLKAVDCLKKAFSNGFRGYDRIAKDKGFENLEDCPEFTQLMNESRP